MKAKRTFRSAHLQSALGAFAFAAAACVAACAQPSPQPIRPNVPSQQSRPFTPPQYNGRGAGQGRPGPQNGNAPRGEHLSQWMQQHGNMSPQQQQRALQSEPGFNQLPQNTQQRMMERLSRLNSMPEQQRQRVLQRGEAMERLDPQQRVQVRSAMGQLSALPEDRRRAVARSFRELRSLPPAQRNQLLGSPEYRQQFNDEERGTLGNLLSVSPMLPPSR